MKALTAHQNLCDTAKVVLLKMQNLECSCQKTRMSVEKWTPITTCIKNIASLSVMIRKGGKGLPSTNKILIQQPNFLCQMCLLVALKLI